MDEIRDVEFVVFTDRDTGLYKQLAPHMLLMQSNLIYQELVSMMAALGYEGEAPPQVAKEDWWSGSLLVAYNDERVHGYVSLKPESDKGAKILSLYVHEQSRRFGIATELLKRIEELAATAGYQHLSLEVMHDNSRAEALYAARGYAFTTKKMVKMVEPD